MARTVYKAELMDRLGRQYSPLVPRDAVPLHVGAQNGSVMLWYETRHASPATEPCWFTVFGTGHAIPDSAVYFGSCQDGDFMWHVYEIAR